MEAAKKLWALEAIISRASKLQKVSFFRSNLTFHIFKQQKPRRTVSLIQSRSQEVKQFQEARVAIKNYHYLIKYSTVLLEENEEEQKLRHKQASARHSQSPKVLRSPLAPFKSYPLRVIMINMPERSTNPRPGKRQRGKKQYDVISYEKRLNLILMVKEQGLSCTKACELLGVKLTTGCLILRTFNRSGRVMRKKDPHSIQASYPPNEHDQLLFELEEKVRLLPIVKEGSQCVVKTEEPLHSLQDSLSASERGEGGEKQKELEVKRQSLDLQDNLMLERGARDVERRDVNMGGMSESDGGVQFARELGWAVPAIIYFPWTCYLP